MGQDLADRASGLMRGQWVQENRSVQADPSSPGHCDPNVTVRIYSLALPADDQRSADVWDSVIAGPVQ